MLTKTKNLTDNSLEVMQIVVAQERKEKWNDKEVQGEKEFIWGGRNKMKEDWRILRENKEEEQMVEECKKQDSKGVRRAIAYLWIGLHVNMLSKKV